MDATKFSNDLLLRLLQLSAGVALDSKDPDVWHLYALEAQSIQRTAQDEIDQIEKGEQPPKNAGDGGEVAFYAYWLVNTETNLIEDAAPSPDYWDMTKGDGYKVMKNPRI